MQKPACIFECTSGLASPLFLSLCSSLCLSHIHLQVYFSSFSAPAYWYWTRTYTTGRERRSGLWSILLWTRGLNYRYVRCIAETNFRLNSTGWMYYEYQQGNMVSEVHRSIDRVVIWLQRRISTSIQNSTLGTYYE